MNEKDLFVAIATHKEFQLKRLEGYYSVLAGSFTNMNSLGNVFDFYDNEGDNISSLNKYYCEITVLYWLWKNIQADHIGLVHYRRFFCYGNESLNIEDDIIRKESINKILKTYDLILPNKKTYFPFNVKNYYALRHEIDDIVSLERIINKRCSEKYIKAYNETFGGYKLHLYNMFITRNELFQEYMSWLIPILSELEEKKIYFNKTDYQARVIGFITERLFNVWVNANINKIKIKYLPVRSIGVETETTKAFHVVLQILGIVNKK